MHWFLFAGFYCIYKCSGLTERNDLLFALYEFKRQAFVVSCLLDFVSEIVISMAQYRSTRYLIGTVDVHYKCLC